MHSSSVVVSVDVFEDRKVRIVFLFEQWSSPEKVDVDCAVLDVVSLGSDFGFGSVF